MTLLVKLVAMKTVGGGGIVYQGGPAALLGAVMLCLYCLRTFKYAFIRYKLTIEL